MTGADKLVKDLAAARTLVAVKRDYLRAEKLKDRERSKDLKPEAIERGRHDRRSGVRADVKDVSQLMARAQAFYEGRAQYVGPEAILRTAQFVGALPYPKILGGDEYIGLEDREHRREIDVMNETRALRNTMEKVALLFELPRLSNTDLKQRAKAAAASGDERAAAELKYIRAEAKGRTYAAVDERVSVIGTIDVAIKSLPEPPPMKDADAKFAAIAEHYDALEEMLAEIHDPTEAEHNDRAQIAEINRVGADQYARNLQARRKGQPVEEGGNASDVATGDAEGAAS